MTKLQWNAVTERVVEIEENEDEFLDLDRLDEEEGLSISEDE